MRIVSPGAPIPAQARGAVVALGNFDGVHRGHQAVLARAAALAAAHGAPLGVVTFDPHPARYFAPGAAPFALTTTAQKLARLDALGVDTAFVLGFDAALASTSADSFIADVLIGQLGVAGAVAGYDFTFGKGRAGNTQLLKSAGLPVDIVEPYGGADPVSSTRVRERLMAGAPDEAAALLGRWWQVAGVVGHGDKRGRTIGFPTANIALGDYQRPRLGVYAVRMHVGGRVLDGVANLGRRPTVGGQDERLEVHLFDFDGDLYDQAVDVDLLAFIRPEQTFDGLPALKAQIARDSAAAMKIVRQPAYAPERFGAPGRQA
jgi:riboflavin kinase / FMN adenylyltransferase